MSTEDEMRAALLRFGATPERTEELVAENMAAARRARATIRAQALTEAADIAEMIGSGYLDNSHSGEGNGAFGVAAELRSRAAILAAPVPAAGQDDIGTAVPNYFRPGHTYTRPSHGRQVEFQVTQVSTAPDGSQRRAFGWHRIEGYSSWSDYSNDDYATWTDTTAPTPADGYAGTRGEPGPVGA